MSGIYVAAMFTSLLGLAVAGGLLWQITEKPDRRLAAALVLCGLPLSIAAFYGVRMPLDGVLLAALGKDSPLYQALRLFYAPFTEEPAKLLPLLVLFLPAFRGGLRKETVAPAALALGLGFAIGEMWLIAGMIAPQPQFAGLPAWAFGGYVSERLLTCFAHGGFVLASVWGLQRGGWRIAAGIALAMALHFLANFPIFLAQSDVPKLGKETWSVLLQLWVALAAAGSVVALIGMKYGAKRLWKVATAPESYCPDCQAPYPPPWLVVNAGFLRYERCPFCRSWHWIDCRDQLRGDPPKPTKAPSPPPASTDETPRSETPSHPAE